MRLIVLPLAFIHVSICVDESASSVSPVIYPVTFIKRVVFPDLFSPTVPHAVTKLTNISNTIVKIAGSLRYKCGLCFLIVFEGTQPYGNFFSFIVVKVLRLQIVVIVSVQD
jgi:hypothetical protein